MVPAHHARVSSIGKMPVIDCMKLQLRNIALAMVGMPTILLADSTKSAFEVAWEVLPEIVVRDNYGRHVSSKYFAIDVAVHNPSDSDVLIVRAFQFANKETHLNSDPRLVRGSLEKGQMTGRRNVAINTIKSMGLVAAGASGFFKNTGSSATYNRSVVMFSDPFEKGLEVIFPDTTIKYLSNWDSDKVFKDGFVVSAGDTGRGRIFVPIQALYPDYTKPKRGTQFDLNEVKERLGDMKPVGIKAGKVEALQ